MANVSLAIAVIIGQKKTREIVILVPENASSAFLIRKVIIANIANQDGLEVPLRACAKNVCVTNWVLIKKDLIVTDLLENAIVCLMLLEKVAIGKVMPYLYIFIAISSNT